MSAKRLVAVVVTALLLGLVYPVYPKSASAEPTFQDVHAGFIRSAGDFGDLVISVMETGLQPNAPVTYLVTSDAGNRQPPEPDAQATYACITTDKHPLVVGTCTPETQLNGGISVRARNNGTVRLTLNNTTEPHPDETCNCPSPDELVFVSVVYTDVILEDTSNNLSKFLGTFAETLCDLAKSPGSCPPPDAH